MLYEVITRILPHEARRGAVSGWVIEVTRDVLFLEFSGSRVSQRKREHTLADMTFHGVFMK